MTSLVANSPPSATYLVFGSPRWESNQTSWTDLPGAKILVDLKYPVILVATFSAEVLASAPDNNGTVFATVFFDDMAAEPASDNQRFVSANGGVSWSSHTFIRTLRITPGTPPHVTAQVKITAASGTKASIQNWLLKVERFDIIY